MGVRGVCVGLRGCGCVRGVCRHEGVCVGVRESR